jgi:hypothetical protein
LSLFDRYFHARYRAMRAYVFSQVFLVTVALDTWLLMIGHAGRYGIEGFNVAHFAWLDRVLPVPSSALYVGVLLSTGLLALTIALGRSHPLAIGLLFGLYTFSWSMSMLDSYQHHYFVSLVLLCLVFFPELRASDVLPLAASAAAPIKPTKRGESSVMPVSEARRELAFLLVSALALLSYGVFTLKSHPWLLFFACAGALTLTTAWHARRLRTREAPLCSGFGYNLLAASVAVLYTFTSIAKMDAQWFAGNTIRRISAAGEVFAPLAAAAGQLGISEQRFWSLLSTSVIPVELLIACGYWLAPLQDVVRSRWLRWATLIAAWLAFSLHIGAEAMRLEIGWFSYYMLLLAGTFLLPGPALESLGLLIARPAQLVAAELADLLDSTRPRRLETLALLVGASLVIGCVGFMLDLPGAKPAALLACASLLLAAAVSWGRGHGERVRMLALSAGCAAATMWIAIAASEVRWDYYRYLGGDLSRRGQAEAALAAYERGEHYAPRGQSRRDKIIELQRKLGR